MADGPRDVLASLPGALIAWGLPVAMMAGVVGVLHPVRIWVWVGALVWIGMACLWNARRCNRAQCSWTGPFVLRMTLPVLGYGYGLLRLGGDAWKWLGAAIGGGAWGIIALTERGGRYS